MCLGQDDAADLRRPLRASESDELLNQAIDEAITRKPKGHDFVIDRRHQRACIAASYEHDWRINQSTRFRHRYTGGPTHFQLSFLAQLNETYGSLAGVRQ